MMSIIVIVIALIIAVLCFKSDKTLVQQFTHSLCNIEEMAMLT
jgi:hypothetical protein